MKRSHLLIAAAIAVLLAYAVGTLLSAKPSVPDARPTSTGIITAYEGGRILVEEFPAEQRGDKCWFAITNQTKIWRQENGSLSAATAQELSVGMRVRAWASGPVAESYPCQATGGVIVVER